jgi:L-threonylcarbamoyladenylate synthase
MIVPVGSGLDDDRAFDDAVARLRAGEVVGLATDTVYGLAALPGDAAAMQRVFALKSRSDAKSVAVLVADAEQARSIGGDALDRFAPWWPGPLTVVVARRAGAVLHLGGDGTTVGVRCPDHDFVRRLARVVGPIAATSANESGQPPLPTAEAVAAAFPELGLVVDGGALLGAPSTVVDATVDPPRLLREGSITAAALGL